MFKAFRESIKVLCKSKSQGKAKITTLEVKKGKTERFCEIFHMVVPMSVFNDTLVSAIYIKPQN